MDKKNKVSWIVPIVVAVIGALGMIGAALINNFNTTSLQNNPSTPPVQVNLPDTLQESSPSASTPKQEIITSPVPAQPEKSHVEETDSSITAKENANDIHSASDNRSIEFDNDFNRSDFIFENKKFIEDRPERFSNGRVSLTIRNSSDYKCLMRISQFFKGQNEIEYELIKGSPLEVSVGGAKYILHFVDGVYREYCIISSYAAS